MTETDNPLRARLPAAVYSLALRLGAKPDDHRDGVRLTQTGRMKRNLEARSWMAFTAIQTMSTLVCEFDWLARFGPFGMISARDALKHGEGGLDIQALGVVPIARAAHTPGLVCGERMRYLAELAWAPLALLRNTELRWREDGPDTLAVSTGAGETASEVMLSLDSDGRIAGTYAPDRPRSVAASEIPTPWRGQFTDYRLHEGFWLPFAGEVAWEINGKPELYWQGRLAGWAMS
jgi:hypothetical protein